MIKLDILGSCVTRDAIEYAENCSVNLYCARQSIVSACSMPVSDSFFSEISFSKDVNNFHRRVIVEDLLKLSIPMLSKSSADLIIVDMIEERVPLSLTRDGTYITCSQPARKYTNILSVVKSNIKAFHPIYIDLFKESVKLFAQAFVGNVVIHRAFYAQGDWEYENTNKILLEYYDMLEENFQNSIVVEVPEKYRISFSDHKWGIAPYHYIDEYYK